jgi:hypothetical protein
MHTKHCRVLSMRTGNRVSVRNGVWGSGEVAHACNPSYSGGGDREDHSLRLGMCV